MSRAAGSEYPEMWACDVVLADGGTLHLRPVRPDDAGRIAAFHGGLSQETVYLRFFHPLPELPPDLLERFSHVDYEASMTLMAELGDEIVALAGYERVDESDAAEVAFVVSDAHQGRGLGTLLLEHLAAIARANGLRHFVADTLDRNASMLSVFRAAGFPVKRVADRDVIHISFPIQPTGRQEARVARREHRSEARSMARLLAPRSIAVVGALHKRGSPGHEIFRNLRAGGFQGAIHAVDAGTREVLGERSYPSILEIPDAEVDLALIAVPAAAVPEVLAQCARKHVHGAVIVSAGFAETGGAGAAAEREVVTVARRHGIRVLGPNCLGVVNTSPDTRMNATFSPFAPVSGRVGFMSQSGSLGVAILERAEARGLGLSTFVCLGNKGDVSGNDLLQYWEEDEATHVILLCLESFGNPRKFSRIARRVARRKPILAVKSGRSVAGRRAAVCHSGARAAPEPAVDALFRQTGVIRVDTVEELFDTAHVLAHQPLPGGRRVAIVGNSGGPGILAADACEQRGLAVPELADDALGPLLPAGASLRNPVDLSSEATADDYLRVLRALLDAPEVDAVIVVHAPTPAAHGEDVAEAIAAAAAHRGDKPLLACLLAARGVPEALRGEDSAGRRAIPCFRFPESAVQALEHATRYAEWRARPEGAVPKLRGVQAARARRLVAAALRDAGDTEEGSWLAGEQVRELLGCYGVALLPEAETAPAGEDGRGRDDAPVVVTSVGIAHEPDFGPLLSLGLVDPAGEPADPPVFRLLPLHDLDARELLGSLPGAPRLFGPPNAPAVDTAALEDVLLRVARLAEEHPEVAELQLAPLLVSPRGAVGAAAHVRVAQPRLRPEHVTRRLR